MRNAALSIPLFHYLPRQSGYTRKPGCHSMKGGEKVCVFRLRNAHANNTLGCSNDSGARSPDTTITMEFNPMHAIAAFFCPAVTLCIDPGSATLKPTAF